MVRYEPVDETESAMLAALRHDDPASYLRLLADLDLVLPMAPGSVVNGQVAFATVELGERTHVAAYTSGQAMAAGTDGAFESYRKVRLAALAETWPNERWWLAVDAGLPLAMNLAPRMVRQVASGDFTVPTRRPAPTAMQKVVPPPMLPAYLEAGYGFVAGYVHRWQDTRELRTPADLVVNLGLAFPGSPFPAEPAELHVIRWPGYCADLYRVPYGGTDEASVHAMPAGWVIEHPPFLGNGYVADSRLAVPEYKVDSVRLPHHAEMWRIAADGGQSLAAVYDADLQTWHRNANGEG